VSGRWDSAGSISRGWGLVIAIEPAMQLAPFWQ
jgi:hypothetical protein